MKQYKAPYLVSQFNTNQSNQKKDNQLQLQQQEMYDMVINQDRRGQNQKNDQEQDDDEYEQQRLITDKEFQKQMQKLKDRGSNAMPPKKSASAYIIFGKEKRAEILKRNPLTKVTEVVKEIAQSWKKLTKLEKQRYKDQSKKDKERYEKELSLLESMSESVRKPKKCLSAYMIFVKETRPQIVDANPAMGALQVMKEVGIQWQNLPNSQRKYFKMKADQDKVRYLEEQKRFYDEVAKVGQKIDNNPQDTQQIQSQIGQFSHIMPSQLMQQTYSFNNPIYNQIQQNGMIKSQIIQSPNDSQKDLNKRNAKIESKNNQKLNQIVQQIDDKPKKPLSAFIYFSQEFREKLKQRFSSLNINQIMKAVNFKWSNLKKQFKKPFEIMGQLDKQRYDEEVALVKSGKFSGKSSNLNMKAQRNYNQNHYQEALEINEDIINFLQIKSNYANKQEEQKDVQNTNKISISLKVNKQEDKDQFMKLDIPVNPEVKKPDSQIQTPKPYKAAPQYLSPYILQGLGIDPSKMNKDSDKNLNNMVGLNSPLFQSLAPIIYPYQSMYEELSNIMYPPFQLPPSNKDIPKSKFSQQSQQSQQKQNVQSPYYQIGQQNNNQINNILYSPNILLQNLPQMNYDFNQLRYSPMLTSIQNQQANSSGLSFQQPNQQKK